MHLSFTVWDENKFSKEDTEVGGRSEVGNKECGFI